MLPLHAAVDGMWPIIFLAIVFALFGRRKAPTRTRAMTATNAPVPAKGSFLGELQRALEEMKRAEAEARRRAVARPVRQLPDDTGATDDTAAEDATDYDEEAVRVVAERQRDAERLALAEASAEELTVEQLVQRPTRAIVPALAAPPVARISTGPGQEIGSMPAPAAPRRRVLGRFADGSPRGAMVIAELLGRPMGER
jgi:hypothetical protein